MWKLVTVFDCQDESCIWDLGWYLLVESTFYFLGIWATVDSHFSKWTEAFCGAEEWSLWVKNGSSKLLCRYQLKLFAVSSRTSYIRQSEVNFAEMCPWQFWFHSVAYIFIIKVSGGQVPEYRVVQLCAWKAVTKAAGSRGTVLRWEVLLAEVWTW